MARYESTHEETSAYFKMRDIQQCNTPELFTLSRSRNTKGPKMAEWGTPKLHLSIKPVIKLTKNDNCFRSLGSNERLKTTRGCLKNKLLQPDGSHIDRTHISGIAYSCQKEQYRPCSWNAVDVGFDLSGGSLRCQGACPCFACLWAFLELRHIGQNHLKVNILAV